MQSALYVGTLRHRRVSPKAHEFSYPVFLSFLDVDEIPELMSRSKCSSYNRWNWLSYFEKDHFGDPRISLRERLEQDASKQGITIPNGKIFLLTHLRYLGYVFNPVSFYYFYDRDEVLRLMMAEVNNTFGESRNYWLTPQCQTLSTNAKRYATPKELHVSPFMPMNLKYEWIFTDPAASLVAHMNTMADGKPFFDATLQLQRRAWTPRELRKVLAAYPFMTLRVIAAIHWQAARLWLKGVPVFTHPGKIADSSSKSLATASSSEGGSS